jgi:hypothetical protein
MVSDRIGSRIKEFDSCIQFARFFVIFSVLTYGKLGVNIKEV